MKKQVALSALLLTGVSCFAASLHPVNFHNDRRDTGISVQYLTGHKYSKCVSYVRPETLMINPGQMQTSNFMDKDSRSCWGGDKYASWLVRTADDSSVVVTLRHHLNGDDWLTWIEVNGSEVIDGNSVPIDGGKYAIRVDNERNIVFY